MEATPQSMYCSRCGDPASMKCSRCFRTHYCGRDCQRAHWPTHKLKCGIADIDPTPEFIEKYLHYAAEKISGNISQMRARGSKYGPGHICINVSANSNNFIKVHDQLSSYMVSVRFQPDEFESNNVIFEFTDQVQHAIELTCGNVAFTAGDLESYVLLEI